MIWVVTPEEASVDKLKALGVASVVFDPCGNVSDSGDWLAVMRANIDALRKWEETRYSDDVCQTNR
jgi:zinc transport system substrate-binding protein